MIAKDKFKGIIPDVTVFLIFVLIILKSIFFSYCIIGHFTKKDIFVDALYVLLLFYFIQLFLKKKHYTILYLVYILYSILLFSNALFYRENGDFLSIAVIKEIGMAYKVEGSILNLAKPYDIFYILDLIILYPYIRYQSKKALRSKFWVNLMTSTFLIAMILLSVFITNYRRPNLMSIEFNKTDVYDSIGLITMTIDDGYNYLTNNSVTTKPSKTLVHTISNQMQRIIPSKLNYKGKNLIIIQVESLQGFVISKKYNGKEITPYLNKFIKQSAYFNNCYYQVGIGHTSDAELLTNTSLYPMQDAAAYMVKADNDYKSIASYADKIGYKTLAFHGNYAGFWNRGAVYKKYGFDKFYSLNNFKKQKIINIGLSDESMFNQTFSILNNTKNPFYSFIITITSHDPFKADNNFCKTNSYITSYYNAINYTDKSIGMFLNKLKKSGLLDKSIIIIYGDHNAIPYSYKSSLSKAVNENLNQPYMWEKYQKVPLIVRLPYGMSSGLYTKSVGQIDALPTVLELLGIKNQKTFGEDLFSKKDNLAAFRNGSYVFGNNYYDNDDKTTYNMLNGSKVANNYSMIKKARNQLTASDNIFKYNYFKYYK